MSKVSSICSLHLLSRSTCQWGGSRAWLGGVLRHSSALWPVGISARAAKGWTALEGILRGIRGQPKLDVEKAEMKL